MEARSSCELIPKAGAQLQLPESPNDILAAVGDYSVVTMDRTREIVEFRVAMGHHQHPIHQVYLEPEFSRPVTVRDANLAFQGVQDALESSNQLKAIRLYDRALSGTFGCSFAACLVGFFASLGDDYSSTLWGELFIQSSSRP